jgi:hypothetical protein
MLSRGFFFKVATTMCVLHDLLLLLFTNMVEYGCFGLGNKNMRREATKSGKKFPAITISVIPGNPSPYRRQHIAGHTATAIQKSVLT